MRAAIIDVPPCVRDQPCAGQRIIMPSMTTRSVSLAAFRVRSFRFQWPADLLTSFAFEMETLILGWFVMVHTGSVLLLTAFGSVHFLGTLAAPVFGVAGDRLGVRTMLVAMRMIY